MIAPYRGVRINRPDFQRLIADSDKKLFEAVVVYKTDRFARNKYDSAIYKRQLKKNGIRIYYAAEAIPDGPEGIILESLMEGLAEYYSAELSQKIKRGMNESALKCHSTGSGRPLGYAVNEDKSFRIDPDGAKSVETIFDMYINGQPKSAICEYLNSVGAKTVQGKAFSKSSVDRIINNEKYVGVYKYADIKVEDGMPAIISKETFYLAQREMDKRRTRKKPKAPKAEYLLSGKLFCGHCKSAMVGVSGTSKTGKKFYYYYCPSARAKTGCTKKQVRREYIEDLIVQQTVDHILKPEVLKDLACKVHLLQENQDSGKADIAYFDKKLNDNKKAIDNILIAIESGTATKTLPARLKTLETEQISIEGELAYLKATQFSLTEEQLEFLLLQHLHPYDDSDDYKKSIINTFVSAVYLYDNKLLTYYNINKEDGQLDASDLELIEGQVFDQCDVSSTTLEHKQN